MFIIKGEAELKNINLRAEIHGDELVRAVDLKLVVVDVPASKLDSAIPGLKKVFWQGKQPAVQEIYPLRVSHKIENVTATLSVSAGKRKVKRVTLREADVQKIQITPKFGGKCDITMSVKASHIPNGILDLLHTWLRGIVKLSISERQLALAGMDQKPAASA